MNGALIQLLVLAGVAIFLILRLKNVLGTRDGFEKPPVAPPARENADAKRKNRFEVIDGGPDRDIVDHVADGTDAAKSLAAMKLVEPGFSVNEFLQGARGAYEMILMAFETGDIESIRPFVSDEVYEAFSSVIEQRKAGGLTVEAEFVGVRETVLKDATFDRDTQEAEVTVRFVGELVFTVRDKAGDIVDGNPNEIKRQRDVWTFARHMGMDDPNWQLVATGE